MRNSLPVATSYLNAKTASLITDSYTLQQKEMQFGIFVMNSDIKIIIAAHKPFKCPVSSDSYHIVTTCQDDSTEYPVEKSIAKDLDVPADKPFYGELYQMYWDVKNITPP